ncbi:MAG: molybdenum cofactor guanylyltransferase [Thermovirgaceae bacterium]|nr:molybdenum cofactor guanylyltransferase [Thermovirgaceae bacterium]
MIDAAALVLAGGRGKRAGGSKIFLSIDGSFLLESVLGRMMPLFRQVLVSCKEEDSTPFRKIFGHLTGGSDVRLVPDRAEGVGPLEGISVGLRSSDHPWVFVVGCDMPMIQESLVRFMWSKRSDDADAVIAMLGGFVEPLHAFYHRRCAYAVERAISRSEHRISSFLSEVALLTVEENDMAHIPGYRRSFLNVNTPVDMRRWQEGISSRP